MEDRTMPLSPCNRIQLLALIAALPFAHPALTFPISASEDPQIEDRLEKNQTPKAQPGSIGNSYNIRWATVDSGGTVPSMIAGGSFTLNGTTGQPETARLTGGPFVFSGGFWPGVGAQTSKCSAPDSVFCSGFESGDTSAWSNKTQGE